MGYLQSRNVFCDYASDLDPILIEIYNEFPWGHGCHRQVFLGAVSAYHIFFDIIVRRKKIKSRNKSIPGVNSIRKKTVRIPASSTHYFPKNMNKKMITTRW